MEDSGLILSDFPGVSSPEGREIRVRWSRKDLWFLLLAAFIVLIPLWQGILNLVPWAIEDTLFYFHPTHRFDAQWIQEGVLPLWDPHMNCGTPNWWRTGIFYLPLYPFWLAADIGDSYQVYQVIELLPILAFSLLGVFNSYLLSRRGFRFSRLGAFVFTLAYMLSPLVLESRPLMHALMFHVWVPLALLGITAYTRHPGTWEVAYGALAVMMILAAGVRSETVQTMISLGSFGCLLAGAFLVCHAPRSALRALSGTGLVLGAGLLLAAPATISMTEAVLAIQPAYQPSYDEIVSASVPAPSFLVHFIPELFGDYSGSILWGPPALHQPIEDFLLVAGMLFYGLLAVGLWRWRFNRCSYESLAWWMSLGMLVLGLILMMGRFTPGYHFISTIFPPFQAPYPIRWRLLPTLGLALMAGATVSTAVRHFRNRGTPTKPVLFYLSFLIAAVLLMFCCPSLGTDMANLSPRIQNELAVASPAQVAEFVSNKVSPDWEWLKWRVFPYLLAGTILLIIWARMLRGYLGIMVIVTLVILELTGWAFYRLYRNPESAPFGPDQSRVAALGRDNIYNDKTGSMAGRFAYPVGTLASIGWDNGSRSFLTFVPKPMLPRFYAAVSRIAKGYPYEFSIQDPNSQLLPNTATRYIWIRTGQGPAPVKGRLLASNDVFSGPSPYPLWTGALFDHSPLTLYELPHAIPRIYTQDTLRSIPEQEQLEVLLSEDLRGGALVDPLDKALTEKIANHGFKFWGPSAIDHFNQLQKRNPILIVREPTPNCLEVEVLIRDPALLVVADNWAPGWRVEVDGLPGEGYQVNYLQRGVWLDKGHHMVIWSYNPICWRWGFPVSLITALILCGLPVIIWVRQKLLVRSN